MPSSRLCLIGQVVLDVRWDHPASAPTRRLGGIVHAARAAYALGRPYDVGYVAPGYLDEAVVSYLTAIGAGSTLKVGTVVGTPNVLLIGHPEEASDQLYDWLLWDSRRIDMDKTALSELLARGPHEVLAMPDAEFADDLLSGLSESNADVYLDGRLRLDELRRCRRLLDRELTCVIVSTSSPAWRLDFAEDADRYSSTVLAEGLAREALLKENRGGSRLYTETTVIQTGAVPTPISHSVGVGDVFDVAFAHLRRGLSDEAALAYAAHLAADYAATDRTDDFVKRAGHTLAVPERDIRRLHRPALAWEDRASINIYLAAPDFADVDTNLIDVTEAALSYHNFRPRRPVRENGEVATTSSREERSRVAHADVELLDHCQCLVAVLLYNDPGTLIEIGMAVARGMPVIIYDPFGIARNVMLTELPDTLCRSLDDVLVALFSKVAVSVNLLATPSN